MDMLSVTGFFSYAHEDDYNNVLTQLQNDLRHAYKVLTGQDLVLFFDRGDIKWGQKWQESINGGIESASFFIPVLSPCYFLSENCVGELSQYMSKMEEWNSADLILPIKWVNFDNNDLVNNSKLFLKVNEVVKHQWEDWTVLRFEEPLSKQYRVAINKMAEHLAEANQRITAAIEKEKIQSINGEEETVEETEEAEEPKEFYDESIRELFPWSQKLTNNLEELSSDVTKIGEIMNSGTSEINRMKNKSPQFLLSITAKLGKELEKIADPYFQKAQDTADLIYSFDSKMNTIIDFLKSADSDDQEITQQIDSVILVSNTTSETRSKLNEFIDSIKKIERMSRPLYKPLQKIKNATTICNSAFGLVEGWGLKLKSDKD